MQQHNLRFAETDQESNTTYGRLGISEERKEALLAKMQEAYDNTNGVAAGLSRMSELVETPLELAWLSYQFGHRIGTQRNATDGLSGLLGALLGGKVSVECGCPKCQAKSQASAQEPATDASGL